MRAGGLAGAELAGRLDDDVDAVVAPGQCGGVAFGADRDLVAVDDHGVAEVVDVVAQRAEGAVVAQQAGQRRGVGDVVDGDDLDVVARRARSAGSRDRCGRIR